MSFPSSTRHASIGVLFVCLGNICRSPMAEAVFRHLVGQAGLRERFSIDSAGTGAWHIGEAPHIGTRRVLQRHGLHTRHTARVIGPDDLTRYDYIIALDRDNLRDLQVMRAGATARVGLLMDYAPQAGTSEVPDPYYSGRFDEAYALVEQGCKGLLAHIRAVERL